MRMMLAVVGFSLWALGCAHGTTIEKVDVDTYHVTCRDLPLDRCLGATVDNVCDKHAYFVARGISQVNQRGRSEVPDISTSSEVIVRCSIGNSWGEEAKALMAPPVTAPATLPKAPTAAPVTPPPPPPPPVCAPGSTQSCVGAGACAGGQACKADGSGYEPCDCGSSHTP